MITLFCLKSVSVNLRSIRLRLALNRKVLSFITFLLT
jgi:hypothetical protein